MLYLSGHVHPDILGHPQLGLMLTPRMRQRPNLSSTFWGADTGCFTQPQDYSDTRYLTWLDSLRRHFPTCLFATAPDVVADAAATLQRSLPMLPHIRRRVPAALVAQDGLEHLEIPWDQFDCLFLGGTTAWKLSEAAYQLVDAANQRGKWTHMGRCNSLRRFTAAVTAGYDSADGTFLTFAPDTNLPRLQRWLDHHDRQPHLQLKENA